MSQTPRFSLQLIGGPTALMTYGGLNILTDPTFDPPGEYPRPGSEIIVHKLAGPAITIENLPRIDVVLLSHDHHIDNLDHSGRRLLAHVPHVLTTIDGATRLGGGNAFGLEPETSTTIEHPKGDVVVTAVLAEHGPPEVAARNGPVIGFVLRRSGLPTVYVSGDNASVDVVRNTVSVHGPIDIAVLFVGGAMVPEAWGPSYLTLSPQQAAEAARLLGDAIIIPVHEDGWSLITAGPGDLHQAFTAAGVADRLRPIAPGDTVQLD